MRKQVRKRFERLYRFAHLFVRFEEEVRQALGGLSAEELASLIEECKQVTDKNCWWPIYEVAPFVERIARQMLARSLDKAGSA